MLAIGGSPHDDRLFLKLANRMLEGQWLGVYDQFTLIKGPAYSAFIAATVAVGLPLPLAQHLLYLLACWLIVRAVRPLLPDDRWALGLFLLLLWQPMSFEGPAMARVLRQNLYTPCTMLVFAGLAALHTRAAASTVVRLGWAALLGFAAGTLWLTREETVWIVPSLGLLVGVAAWFAVRSGGRWTAMLPPVATAACFALLPVVVVCALNARFYGWWGTVEFRAPQFVAAYGAFSRIDVGADRPHLPLSQAGREAAYAVSPAFAELRPWLEGGIGERYAAAAAEHYPFARGERELAGWWMWALRDAVRVAGRASDAPSALAFYQRLADEVNAACDRSAIPAGPPRATLAPRWRPQLAAAFWHELPGYVGDLAFFRDFDANVPASRGDASSLRLFRDLTQWHLSPAPAAPTLDTPTATSARSYRIAVLNAVGRILCWLCAVVTLTGAVAWLAGLVTAVRKRTWPGYSWWLQAGLACAVACTVILNLLVHVSSFPRSGPAALSQTYPLVLLFGGLALADFRWQRAPSGSA